MFKNMRLPFLFDILFLPSFKMTASFTNVAKTKASKIKFIYYEIFQIIMDWVFIRKINFNFE